MGVGTVNYSIDDRRYSATARGDDIMVDGKAHRIDVISSGPAGVEFLLDDRYYSVTYLEESPGKLAVEINGTVLDVMTRTGLDDIVYKNTGGAGATSAESALLSQIPGKVVSVAVSPGDAVSRGDTICVLESMKMQVSVKSHADGTVKAVRAKVGENVAKGDMIAEIE